MKSIKVNKFFTYILLRLFLILSFVSLTFLITGQIADMGLYISDCTYDCADYAPRTLRAIQIFSPLQNVFLSQSILIIFITSLSSTFLYFLCKPFVDKENFKYWTLLLISPCLLIYSNVPTKEVIFLYPTILYIILE